MKRRTALQSGALVLPGLARAQSANRLPRVVRISLDAPLADLAGPEPANPWVRGFVQRLRELGWVDGRNVILEHRSAEGRPDRLPTLLGEAVALPADVIVTAGSAMALAARKATTTIPIIAVGPDHVALGLANSLARPGGNVTGLSFSVGTGIGSKRLELLKRAVPAARRVAVIRPRASAGDPPVSAESVAAAQALGLVLSIAPVDGPGDFDAAFAEMSRNRPDAITGRDSPLNIANRGRIAAFAARERLPSIFGLRVFTESGALMSYGINLVEIERRAAGYVDKILKGAKPGELPIELPTRFELVINQKTAKALGITIPKELLLQADDVIE